MFQDTTMAIMGNSHQTLFNLDFRYIDNTGNNIVKHNNVVNAED